MHNEEGLSFSNWCLAPVGETSASRSAVWLRSSVLRRPSSQATPVQAAQAGRTMPSLIAIGPTRPRSPNSIQAHAESLLRYNPSTDTWSRGRPIPGVDRGLPTVVWTGRELVVWGGSMIVRHGRSDYDMSLRDGYAYRPATDHWRSLPAAPIGAWGAVGAWDGHRVLVWGGEATRNQGRERFVQEQGAAYDPITNAWSGLPQAPIPGTHSWDLTGAWTGRELVVIVTALRHSEHSEGAAYNPNTGRWRALPPGPTGEWLGGVRSVWTDQALVVLPGPFGRQALQYFPGY